MTVKSSTISRIESVTLIETLRIQQTSRFLMVTLTGPCARHFRILAMGALLLIGTGVGCSQAGSRSPPRFPVQGTVTLDRAPLPEGRITFRSVDGGLADEFPIQDGRFNGQAIAGAHRVEVSVVKPMKPTGPPIPGMPDAIPTESLPAQFNSESRLTASVSESGPNDFSFQLVR